MYNIIENESQIQFRKLIMEVKKYKAYNTRQKMQIIEMLKQNKHRHMTVDEMMFYLTVAKISVSRATLYRYLDVLVQTGSVKKYIVGEGDKACYQYVDADYNCRQHFHLMCIECGVLQHLECGFINNIIEHVESEHQFKVDPGRVVLYGVCANCQKKEE